MANSFGQFTYQMSLCHIQISAQLHVIEAQERHRVVSPSINVQHHKGLVSIKGPPGPGRL